MKFDRWGETILGAIVALVAIGFFAFAAAQSGQVNAGGGSYVLTARFQNVSGIAVGADVRVSGVKVGVVREIALDPTTYMAQLTLALDPAVQVLDSSTARVASDGLLGGAHIAIEPSGLDPIPSGGEIVNTQGAIDLLTMFASFAQGSQDDTQNEEISP